MLSRELDTSKPDLSTLSLDAALQLDKVERHQHADLGVIKKLLDSLGSTEQRDNYSSLNFHDRPLNVEIFSSAIYKAQHQSLRSVDELQERISMLLAELHKVSEGGGANAIGALKTFCLSLHEALITDISPYDHHDDWANVHENRAF